MDASKQSSDFERLATGMEIDSATGMHEYGEIVRRLEAVLKPVEPSPFFTESLRLRLIRAARKESSRVQIASSNERSREMLVGAALLSVAGALMYLWRIRGPHVASRATALLESGQTAQNVPSTAA